MDGRVSPDIISKQTNYLKKVSSFFNFFLVFVVEKMLFRKSFGGNSRGKSGRHNNQRHDTQHNGTQHNDTQQSVTQHIHTQHSASLPLTNLLYFVS
jgi:hypothetical protein